MTNSYPKGCCHRDGYLRSIPFAVVVLLCLTIGMYTLYVAFNGSLGAPLSPLTTNILIFIGCGVVLLVLVVLYRQKERDKTR